MYSVNSLSRSIQSSNGHILYEPEGIINHWEEHIAFFPRRQRRKW